MVALATPIADRLCVPAATGRARGGRHARRAARRDARCSSSTSTRSRCSTIVRERPRVPGRSRRRCCSGSPRRAPGSSGRRSGACSRRSRSCRCATSRSSPTARRGRRSRGSRAAARRRSCVRLALDGRARRGGCVRARRFPRPVVPWSRSRSLPLVVWSSGARRAGRPSGAQVRFLDVGQGDAALSPRRAASDPGRRWARPRRRSRPSSRRSASGGWTSSSRAIRTPTTSSGCPPCSRGSRSALLLEPGCPTTDGARGAELCAPWPQERVPIRHPRAASGLHRRRRTDRGALSRPVLDREPSPTATTTRSCCA